jgi:hypothetical protein
MDMETVVAPMRSLNWGDAEAVEPEISKALASLLDDRNRPIIRQILLALPERPELLRLCEHYDILDKLVLWDDPTGFRVRLHVFLPGYFDRPHNHRWSYTSSVLTGQYRHVLFGDAELDEHVDPASLKPVMVRWEQAGSAYVLHHTMVHAVVAEPYTVSLVIRGPAVKDRFLVMDRKTGESWWQYGAGRESAEEAAKKQMSVERLLQLVDRLRDLDVF